MLSHLGRHVSCGARPVVQSMYMCRDRRSAYSMAKPDGLLEVLTQRGFIHDVTRPQALQESLESKRHVIYAGVDPTAKSLHIGHLIPLMCLLHFQIRGHKVIPLIGGATGLIGDPSGRTVERELANVRQVEDNVNSLTKSIRGFFSRAILYANARIAHNNIPSEPAVMSNLQWHAGITMLEFLQKIGVYARVNTMLNRESVRTRLNSQQGLSFTEFTYQLLQAYDFYYLHKHFGCTIQVGGSDQWGNILAGLELITRIDNVSLKQSSLDSSDVAPSTFGITTPLLTTASGEKFGKSAGNAIWLDSNMTSVFDFYQYFIKVDDADVEKYLKLFTLLSSAQINEIVNAHRQQPEKRIAQRRLAAEVTEMVHSATDLVHAQTRTRLLFESDVPSLKADQIASAFRGDPRLIIISEAELFHSAVVKLAAKYGLTSSATAARSLVASGGFYLNNRTIDDPRFKVMTSDLIDGRVAIFRAGKNKLVILVTDSGEVEGIEA